MRQSEHYRSLTPRLALSLAAPHTWVASAFPALFADFYCWQQGLELTWLKGIMLLAACVFLQSAVNTLNDYFDLEQILKVYESCGIRLDKEKMEEYFSKELSFFGNEEVCRIQLHDCIGREELAVTGLLFGYPVESTIALIRRDIDMCE